MQELAAQIEEAADVIRQRWSGRPRVGIILGTGLGSLAEQIETEATLDYESIPHFPRSTAVGHAGQLVCGRLAGRAGGGHGRPLPRLRRLLATGRSPFRSA